MPVANETQDSLLKEAVFRDLLRHPALLRLKGVNLLGAMGFFHRTSGLSRYDHSLGCAELANLFLNSYRFRDEDRYAILLVALLHDIGHPPFSHSTELSLYRMFNRYHRGQTSLMLRNHTSYFPNVTSIQQVITNDTHAGSAVFRKVLKTLQAISQNGSTREPIYQILRGPVNIDTMDAIKRAASALGLPFVEPREIIGNLRYDPSEGILFDHNALSLLQEFWHLKNLIYQRYIFDLKNQAVEAMVNRAVSLVYEGTKGITPFYFLTDEQLIDVLLQDQRSSFLWDLISKGQPFAPVWDDLQPFVIRQGETNFSTALKARRVVESWFAKRLGIPEEERFKVIFHVVVHT